MPLKEFLRAASWKTRRFLNRKLLAERQLTQMRRFQDPAVRRLADAFERVLQRRRSPEEAAWQRRIEQRREEMATRDDELFIINSHVHIRDAVGTGSQKPGGGLLLMNLVRAFRPQHALEIGSLVGMSAMYQGAALDLNAAGRMVAIDASADAAEVARQSLHSVGVGRVEMRVGLSQNTLPAVKKEITPLDYAFVDGGHQGDLTYDHFTSLLPILSKEAILVFDDIRWSPEMGEAWNRIKRHPRTHYAADLFSMGVCLVRSEEQHPTATFRLGLW